MSRIMTIRAPPVCGFSSILTPASLPPPRPLPLSLIAHARAVAALAPQPASCNTLQPSLHPVQSPPPSSSPPQVIGAKLERLLAAAPAATLDCSHLFDAQRLLSAIAHAATKHAGTASCAAAAQSAAALSHATPAAAAAAVHAIYMSGNFLQPQHMPELVEQLRKFPALKQLDVSANPALGGGGAAALLSSLAGMHVGARA